MWATTRRKKLLTNQYNLRLKWKQPENKPINQVIVIIFLLNCVPVLQIIFHHSTYESKTPNNYSKICKLRTRMVVTKLVPKLGVKKERSSVEARMHESVSAFQSHCPNVNEQKLGKSPFQLWLIILTESKSSKPDKPSHLLI